MLAFLTGFVVGMSWAIFSLALAKGSKESEL
jgi:hypothetical protein